MYLVTYDSDTGADVPLVGGKASALFRLYKNKISVPLSAVVTTKCYEEYISDGKLSDERVEEIMKSVKDLGKGPFAVRSSAVAEDGGKSAWAGQFETFLDVSEDEVVKRIYGCMDSSTSERVKIYAAKQGQSDLRVAVLIQSMIPVACGGVIFTQNPINHQVSEMVIEAVVGSGDLLVKGEVTPDTYILDKPSGKILSASSGIGEAGNVLSVEQLVQLRDVSVAIEKNFETPQDIEWGIYNDEVHIFQSRPITTI